MKYLPRIALLVPMAVMIADGDANAQLYSSSSAAADVDNTIDAFDMYSPKANIPTDPTEIFLVNTNHVSSVISGGLSSNNYSAIVDGHMVVLTTNASNFNNATSSSQLTVTVDGKTIFNRQASAITFQDECNVDVALGGSGVCPGVPSSLLAGIVTSATIQADNAAQAATVNRQEARAAIDLISRRITGVLMPAFGRKVASTGSDGKPVASINGNMAGMSSGDSDFSHSVWASYSHSWMSNNWQALQSRTQLNSAIIGGDIKINGNLLAGMTFTYQNSGTNKSVDSDAGFGTVDNNSYIFVPYGALSLMDGALVFDVMTGYGFSSASTKRDPNNSVTGSYGSDRWLAATHATYNAQINDFSFATKAGWMMSYDWSDAYTESDGTANNRIATKVGEISIGERMSYPTDNCLIGRISCEIYVGATFNYDLMLTPNAVGNTGNTLSRKELEGLIGANFYPDDNITAGIEISNSFFRTNEDNTSVVATGRYRF